MYVMTQAIAVRRQSDKRTDVISIRRVFDELVKHHEVVLDFSVQPLGVDQLEQKIEELEEISRDLRTYTNKRLAHYDDTGKAYSATFGDIDRSIDHLGQLLQDLQYVLKDTHLVLEPIQLTSWTEIFKHPWVTDTE